MSRAEPGTYEPVLDVPRPDESASDVLGPDEPTGRQPKRSFLVLKAVLLVINIIFGIFGFFFFAWKLNFRAGWGFLTLAMICGLYLYLNCDVMKGNLHESYSFRRFKLIFILSIVMGLIQLWGSIIYTALGSVYQETLEFTNGFYVAVIPSSMACLWSFLLAIECKYYLGQLSTDAAVQI